MSQLPDLMNGKDPRGIPINEVGISGVRHPLKLPLKDGGEFSTVADISMTVALPHEQRGTHMSRFQELLDAQGGEFSPLLAHRLLHAQMMLLEAEEARISMTFPMFLRVIAPASRASGLMDYDVRFQAVGRRVGGLKPRRADDPLLVYQSQIGVIVPATSLCPCSREISQHGAHNQRSKISIFIARDPIITSIAEGPIRLLPWIEDLIKLAEDSASCPVYPILKRVDEKWVTEAAYSNPRFVEDIVREASFPLMEMMDRDQIHWFRVTCMNQESIHNHQASARVEMGDLGHLQDPWE
jgi:GTP cyclohydrolase I